MGIIRLLPGTILLRHSYVSGVVSRRYLNPVVIPTGSTRWQWMLKINLLLTRSRSFRADIKLILFPSFKIM